MFTIRFTDQDGFDRLTQGEDVRAEMDGKQARAVGWYDPERGMGALVDWPTTLYVMDAGATVAKYVVLGPPETKETEAA